MHAHIVPCIRVFSMGFNDRLLWNKNSCEMGTSNLYVKLPMCNFSNSTLLHRILYYNLFNKKIQYKNIKVNQQNFEWVELSL